jgi:aspartyl/glutamyl-tRNA(Asn/Gln) amidotransferase C subunit
MADELTVEIFNHLVELAALELDAQQAEYLRRELNHQLQAIHELEAIPLDDSVPPALHGVPFGAEVRPELRADEWSPFPKPREIIALAPDSEDGYVVVPDIPTTKLE